MFKLAQNHWRGVGAHSYFGPRIYIIYICICVLYIYILSTYTHSRTGRCMQLPPQLHGTNAQLRSDFSSPGPSNTRPRETFARTPGSIARPARRRAVPSHLAGPKPSSVVHISRSDVEVRIHVVFMYVCRYVCIYIYISRLWQDVECDP